VAARRPRRGRPLGARPGCHPIRGRRGARGPRRRRRAGGRPRGGPGPSLPTDRLDPPRRPAGPDDRGRRAQDRSPRDERGHDPRLDPGSRRERGGL
ncbi:hypothetical protein HK102_011783, partial [Quaeritorhiza haematococci]